MIEIKVGGFVLDAAAQAPGIVLHDLQEQRALAIWIGPSEAQSIMHGVQKIKSKRPLTHDLLHSVILNLGADLHHVEITNFSEGTFFAELVLMDRQETITRIDARPSDAIALAVRKGVPIFIDPSVMEQAGHPMESQIPDMASDEEDQAFRKFLSGLRASDFKLPS